ncbi:RluA family pseudouridine synthase [Anaerosalibacter bizertensis]|uniref:Pseudouridine synthase n=1 Tax=Anaerosalibacter bizertensis TaxID=932217 RepID=A0A9Q4AA10_9FIRM|nr:RluA family pseudouridine synthase [Anaerosalibacter bizertensis]MBV1816617.1 RluA family pseudouridine synthase [Bacteroidales bacterium MSK.15.36]MCB5560612.1 RluA family pseudouridine synthase [Anaerosalibacter bizertensis]MCG4564004.1 RluA family pseudouridine synthase [Anaerosalibacter bizertensis]MCG4581762.1 RluA family pseudouridine synthase [Anaerosalibacter bizertensis]MCG4586153.1 RluA family pseudouridine synthase [Anaerosalibacter bizertensis]
MNIIEIYVDEDKDIRIDSYLAEELKEISRSNIQKMIKEGLITVNGKKIKPRYLVRTGDYIEIKILEPKKINIPAENIPLNILYEDDDIAIIDKPQGMVVHPASGNYSGTLVNALLYHMDSLSTMGGQERPGIVHRLDKDTSGLLIISKNDFSHSILVNEIKERRVKRIYYCLVYGNVKVDKGVINAPIGRDPVDRRRMTVIDKNSKEAITHFKVLERFNRYTLLEVELETGRTHQIRVHMAYIGHPVVGDIVYSNKKSIFGLKGQLLHAKRLSFYHPRKGDYLEFESELPNYFISILKKVKEG